MRALAVLAVLTCPVAAQFADWPRFPDDIAPLLWKGETKAALQLLRQRADAGNADAMFFVGRFLEEVQGIPHDYQEAMRWYLKAADAKIGAAAYSAGRLHEMGRGTPIDIDKAREWYGKARDLGFLRIAWTKVHARWYPGEDALTYEPVPESLRKPHPPHSPELAFMNQPPPDIEPDELQLLRDAGVRGRIAWTGSEPGLFGLPARIILIAHQRITEEVRLAQPVEGVVIYLQRGGTWDRIPHDAKLSGRFVTLAPNPTIPRFTEVWYETHDGGRIGSTIWDWEQP